MRRSVRRRNHMWRRVFGTELKRLLKTRSVLHPLLLILIGMTADGR